MSQILLSIIIIVILYFKLTYSVDTVFVPVSLDQLYNNEWSNQHYMKSTCGNFEAYRGNMKNIAGRWFTVYTSKTPQETDYCSQFTNVEQPCGCLGIDFAIALGHGLISFVMFSRNADNKAMTYEMGTASLVGNSELNMKQIVLWNVMMRYDSKVIGNGGYIIPNGVVVDTDNFRTYMILLFCKEGGMEPTIMVLVKTLPMSSHIQAVVLKYLNENDLNKNLLKVDHRMCKYSSSIL